MTRPWEESKRLEELRGYSVSRHVAVGNTACFEASRDDSRVDPKRRVEKFRPLILELYVS